MARDASSPNPTTAADELAEARRDAERERLKAAAFASMSHEIRTLLTGVIGCTQLLLDTELSAEQRDYAKRIRGSGDALLALINNILDFTRIDAGKLTLERADIDVRRVVEDVGELLAERAVTRGIELVVDLDDKLPATLHGDPARLRQVVLNLASNAIKFTERGEVVLRAVIVEEASEETVVRFEVCDTGIGITPDGLSRLFQPFSQDVGAARYGGSGLGLAISKELVEAMGGRIGCESAAGKGSRFYATVPFGKRRSERVPIPRIDLAARRVLVVEDNAAARAAVLSMLQIIGVDARAAADGAEALATMHAAAASGAAFDVAIVDATLPDVSAPELCEAVRADESLATTRLVLMAYPGARVHGAALAATLPKPLRYSQLATCLFTLLGSHVERVGTPGRGMLAVVRLPSAPEEAPRERPCVLVVEDNVVNQRVARFMLEKRGYDCSVVDGGEAAVAAVRTRAFAAILMDCQMPKLDGYQTTAAIRALDGSERRTPIVAMTANVGAGARELCIAAGMDDYLSKPMVPQELDLALERWCPTTRRHARPLSGEDSRPVVPIRRSTPPPASTRTPSPTPLDPYALERLRIVQREGEPDLVAEVVALFLGDAPQRIGAIRAAAAAGDGPALEQTAHALKGSAWQIGAVALADTCERLEDLGRAGRPDTAALANELPSELERLATALRHAGLVQ